MKSPDEILSEEGQSFQARGKLLLTAEYAVLDGAISLALPTRFGQHLRAHALGSRFGLLRWQSFDADDASWITLELKTSDFSLIQGGPENVVETLQNILRTIRAIQPDFMAGGNDVHIETRLEFPRDWGLGSSSTLISLLSQWTHIDPFVLNDKVFGGSGYDIACATANGPLLFQRLNGRPQFESFPFQPGFSENLFFVYLGQKQNSRDAIKHYRAQPEQGRKEIVKKLSEITESMLDPDLSLPTFEKLIRQHEEALSPVLGMPRVKELLFADFPGEIKSLGAWGGDFVLAVSKKSLEHTQYYFKSKGYPVVVKYADMIL